MREITVHKDPSARTWSESAGYFLKYGTLDKDGLLGITKLENELESLNEALLLCRAAHGLGEGTVAGFAKQMIAGLTTIFG
jgi:hypothetical protein